MGRKNQAHMIRWTTVSSPEFFRVFLDDNFSQILVLNSGRMVAPCGTRKRVPDILLSSLDHMGLVAPEHLSIATRETRHIRFTLAGLPLRVAFSSRWLCRSRSPTAISQTATTLLVVDEAKNVVAQHRNSSRCRRNHNNHVPTARGDA